MDCKPRFLQDYNCQEMNRYVTKNHPHADDFLFIILRTAPGPLGIRPRGDRCSPGGRRAV